MIYEFSDLTLDLDRHLLTRGGQPIKLTKLCFKVLQALVQAAPALISHDDLIDQVWGPKRVITPDNLSQRMKTLRQSLGDDPNQPIYIEGVRGEGYRLVPEVKIQSAQASSRSSRQALSSRLLVSLVVLALALGYFALDKFVFSPERQAANVEEARLQGRSDALVESYGDRSIAVLPLVDMSVQGDQEYLSDGVAEELTNLLAKIPEFRVTSRSSAFAFKGEKIDIPAIAKSLGVAYILEGSLRMAGNQLRITTQLIDARSDTHVWSQTYDRSIDDIFAIQDEIAAAVVRELKVTLLGELPEQRPTDPEVYTLYLQGIHFINRGGKENAQRAVQVLKQALAIDPEYAPAWSRLSYAYGRLEFYGGLPLDEGIALAMQALDKALEIDDQLASAWASLAWMKRTVFWDWQGARAALEKALQLEPNNVQVISVAASIASTFGELDKSIELFERKVESNPLSLSTLVALGNRYVAVGRHVEARTLYERVLALNPEYPGTRVKIAGTYLYEGRPEEALAKLTGLPNGAGFRQIKAAALFDMGEIQKAQMTLDDIIESPSKDGPLPVALLYAWRGENDEAFEWLEMALEQRIPTLSYILINPVLSRLKDDPRFPIFLEKMDLREAWEAMPSEYGGPSK